MADARVETLYKIVPSLQVYYIKKKVYPTSEFFANVECRGELLYISDKMDKEYTSLLG